MDAKKGEKGGRKSKTGNKENKSNNKNKNQKWDLKMKTDDSLLGIVSILIHPCGKQGWLNIPLVNAPQV